MKRTKKIENKECPYRNIIIVVRSGLPIYWCHLFFDERECIFKEYEHDAGECSYYLFPEPSCKNYNKKKCLTCPCKTFIKTNRETEVLR